VFLFISSAKAHIFDVILFKIEYTRWWF